MAAIPSRGESLNDERVLLVMVGLPARGKSYISHKIKGYLSWLGIKCKIFNCGQKRRKETQDSQDHEFFDASNVSGKLERDRIAMDLLNHALEWLGDVGEVALFDATNSTKERRHNILEYCKSNPLKLKIVFIESICNDEKILEENFRQKAKNSPDYKEMDIEVAMSDLRKRISNYERVYQTIDSDALSYIKLINLQSKVVCNKIRGHVPHLLVSFLMCIHIGDRPIYLSRPGHIEQYDMVKLQNSKSFSKEKRVEIMEEMVNKHNITTGRHLSSSSRDLAKRLTNVSIPHAITINSTLNESGRRFASRLVSSLNDEIANYAQEEDGIRRSKLKIYTSTLPRAIETVQGFSFKYRPLSCLNMLDTGICHGMSVDTIREYLPEEWEEFRKNPFHYRIPGGESYSDLVQRLGSFIIEMERERSPVLIVSHLSTLQVIYGYLLGKSLRESFKLKIPAHTVIKLAPTQYGWQETRINLTDETLNSNGL